MMKEFTAILKRMFRRPHGQRIMIFGDSHVDAVKRAIAFEGRSAEYANVEAYRVKKKKGNIEIGEIDLDGFCRKIKRLSENDIVISLVGGNQYAVVSTIKSDLDAHVLESDLKDYPDISERKDSVIIPRQALKSYIASGVWNSDGPVIRRIRSSTLARVIHISPPPPKEDNNFIRNSHETVFRKDDGGAIEPTDPDFRLRCWRIQFECLVELCSDIGVELLPPPPLTVTADGYLDRPYYGKDVTHANRRYGDQVLRQIPGITSAGNADQMGEP